LRKQQLESGRPVLEAIFKSFRVERGMENGNPFGVLQEQLALNAPELIQHNFIDLKTLIATIQSLEAARGKDGSGAGAEQALQTFLRGGEAEPQPEGPVQ
jgi:hypothetical protein